MIHTTWTAWADPEMGTGSGPQPLPRKSQESIHVGFHEYSGMDSSWTPGVHLFLKGSLYGRL